MKDKTLHFLISLNKSSMAEHVGGLPVVTWSRHDCSIKFLISFIKRQIYQEYTTSRTLRIQDIHLPSKAKPCLSQHITPITPCSDILREKNHRQWERFFPSWRERKGSILLTNRLNENLKTFPWWKRSSTITDNRVTKHQENDAVDVLYMPKLLMTVETADRGLVRNTVVIHFRFVSFFTFFFHDTSYF